ncbi:MAG: CinA family protein [Lysobacterales bacterium]
MTQNPSLAQLALQLGEALKTRQLRLMTAESCTGGWIAKAATDVAGSSDWFEGGVVTYSNGLKHRLLGVDLNVIEAEGAVSEAVVLSMASGAAALGQCHAAVSVSGVAGPGGGSADKPVGTVWFGFFLEQRCWAVHQHFEGEREAVREASVRFSLDHLRHALTAAED